MAIKGSYTWRGINLPEAYVRIANVQGNPRDGFTADCCIFSSPAFAANPDNKYKFMQGAQVRVEATDPTQLFSLAYAALKQLPEMSGFVDC
jgi:hypothetical protein